MEDQDITMLQLAGANMNPNDFLINIINKFNLVPWTQVNFMKFHKFQKFVYDFVSCLFTFCLLFQVDFNCNEDDSIRQVNTLAEEFLSTLIYILSERFVPKGKKKLNFKICLHF